jgi:hypothetical protein
LEVKADAVDEFVKTVKREGLKHEAREFWKTIFAQELAILTANPDPRDAALPAARRATSHARLYASFAAEAFCLVFEAEQNPEPPTTGEEPDLS